MNNHSIKVLFGLVIFLFGVALAIFTAVYLRDGSYFDYWGTIAIFAGAYVLIGIAVSMIFPISLGFLFSADVLILYLLFHYYGDWADILKLIVIGFILAVLYLTSAFFLKDKSEGA